MATLAILALSAQLITLSIDNWAPYNMLPAMTYSVSPSSITITSSGQVYSETAQYGDYDTYRQGLTEAYSEFPNLHLNMTRTGGFADPVGQPTTN